MGSLNQIVNVSISRQTSVPSRAGFGTGAFASAEATFPEATKVYTSYAEMETDVALCGADSLAFGAAYFGQEVAPTKLTVIKAFSAAGAGETEFQGAAGGTDGATFDFATSTTHDYAMHGAGFRVYQSFNSDDVPIPDIRKARIYILLVDGSPSGFEMVMDIVPNSPDGVPDATSYPVTSVSAGEYAEFTFPEGSYLGNPGTQYYLVIRFQATGNLDFTNFFKIGWNGTDTVPNSSSSRDQGTGWEDEYGFDLDMRLYEGTGGKTYSVKVDNVEIGQVISVSSDAATLTNIATLLETHASIESATSDGVDTIAIAYADLDDHTVAIDVIAGTEVDVIYTETVAASSITEGLGEAVNHNNDWYVLSIASRDAVEIEKVSDWVQAQGSANPKLFFAQSSDAGILDSGVDTDIASVLQAKAAFRTSIWFHADDSEYLDGGVVGGQLPSDPGSITWAYKSVSGVTVDALTDGQKSAAHAKACNTYDVVANTNITEEGKVSDSPFEWIDVIRGVDWIQVNMAADLFTLLVNLPKIPYTNKGIGVIYGAVLNVLTRAVTMGILSTDVAPTVSVPKAENVSLADKGNRVLNGVTFNGVLAGAVQKINVAGVVTL